MTMTTTIELEQNSPAPSAPPGRPLCLVCGAATCEPFLDLGSTALANQLPERITDWQPRFPLRVCACPDCRHVQLADIVPPEAMFTEYLYVSSASTTLSAHFVELAAAAHRRAALTPADLAVDIGSNDGSLLAAIMARGARVRGVDPAANLAGLARERGVETDVAYFDASTAGRLRERHGPARLIAATNSFPHIPRLHSYLDGIEQLLASDGIFVIEAHYLADLVEHNAFDTIYHEHVSYWSLGPLERLLARHSLEVFDVERLPIHHGQLRVWIARRGTSQILPSVKRLRAEEENTRLGHPDTLDAFAGRVQALRQEIAAAVSGLRAAGVTVAGYGTVMATDSRTRQEREIVRRFASQARNEEGLAGEFALLRARAGRATPEAAMTVLTAGVALRPYAQERAWLPGESGPTVAELESRYGLSSIEFDANIPLRWRPYYRRALDDALTDMRRVFPTFNLTGLKVRFGDSPLGDKALAMHDPVSRTVYFPPGSGAGVMAHEFAHDLDWQAARRRYGVSIGYRTDRAVRQQADWLAGAVRRMAGAPRSRYDSLARDAASERPTEVFARNVDWFVSAALARDARMNGYLSAAQDPVLTGYASATTPEAARDAGEATLRALDGISPPSPKLRAWFDDRFGGGRRVTAHESVRRVLETPLEASEFRRYDAWTFTGSDAAVALLRTVPATSSAWACLLDGFSGFGADRSTARAVTQFAAQSRARGVVKQWATLSANLGPRAPWRMRALEGAPWSPEIGEQLTRQIRDAIMWHAVRDPGNREFPARSVRSGNGNCTR